MRALADLSRCRLARTATGAVSLLLLLVVGVFGVRHLSASGWPLAGADLGLVGVAGVLFVAVGRLQELVGLAPAMGLSYLTLVPAAILAFAVLTRNRAALSQTHSVAIPPCACAAVVGAPTGCSAYGEASCACDQARAA